MIHTHKMVDGRRIELVEHELQQIADRENISKISREQENDVQQRRRNDKHKLIAKLGLVADEWELLHS